MLEYGIQTAALTFSALNLEVRVNVELRDTNGRVRLSATTDEVVVAKIETVKAIAELMHYELVKELIANKRSVAATAERLLKDVYPTIVHHDQSTVDLFHEAVGEDQIEMFSIFESDSAQETLVAHPTCSSEIHNLTKSEIDAIWE
jgi:hypothetical protein